MGGELFMKTLQGMCFGSVANHLNVPWPTWFNR